MSELAQAYVQIIPSMQGITQNLSKNITGSLGSVDGAVSSKASGWGRKITATLGGAFKGVATVGAASFAAVAGAALSFIPNAVAASDATDKFKSTLKFAGLGSSQIDALAASARKYADTTVYSLSDIQNITAQLAANNVKDFDKLAQAAGNLNAVSGGNAETFKRVGMVLTQTAGAGKLTTENWNQLADAIPGASGVLQDAMLKNGAYTGNFRDAMARGEITAEEFNDALMQLGFDKTAQEAATSTTTFENAFGNLQAALEGGLMDAVNKIKPQLIGLINSVTPVVEQVTGALTSFLGSIDFSNLNFDFLSGMMPAIGAVTGALGGLASNIPIIGSLFQGLSGPVGVVIGLFTGMLTNSEALRGAFTGLFQTVGSALQGLAPVFGQVFTMFGTVLGQLGDTLAPIVTMVGQIVAQIAATVIPVIGQIIAALTPLISTLLTILTPAIEALMPVVQTTFTTIISILQPAIETIKAVISTAMAVISGDWSGAWNGIKSIVSNVWETIKTIISGALEIVKSVISTAWSGVKSIFSSAWGAITGVVKTAWGNIKSAVSNGISNAVSLVKQLPSKILSALGNLGSLLYNSGKSLLQGLWNGISSAIGGVKNKISGALSSIRNLFPFSPAKEGPFSGKGWVLYSGLSIGEALSEGMRKATPAAVKTAGMLSSLTRDALDTLPSRAQFSPSISPSTVPNRGKSGGENIRIEVNVRPEDLAGIRRVEDFVSMMRRAMVMQGAI